MPLLGVPSNEALDVFQELLGDPYLVCSPVAGALRNDVRRRFCDEGVVRQPVDTDGQQRSPGPQRDRRRSQRNRRGAAEEQHGVTAANDVSVDGGDHHLLLVQRLSDLPNAGHCQGQDADPKARACVAIPLEQGPRLQLLGEEADRRQRGGPDRRDDLVRTHVTGDGHHAFAESASRFEILHARHPQ